MNVFDIHRHFAFGPEPSGELGLLRVPQRSDFAGWVKSSPDVPLAADSRVALQPPAYYVLTQGLEDTRRLNDLTRAVADALGARAPVVLGTVEPHHGEEALAEIDRMARELRFAGIAWRHRAHGTFVDGPIMSKYVARAADRGLVPLLHGMPRSGNEALWRVWRLAEQFPSVPIVVVGALASWDQTQAILAEPGRAKNVVYDTSGLANGPDALLPLAERLGPERLVFGSGAHCDEPLTAAQLAGDIARSSLPAPLQRAILWDNAARLFSLAPLEGKRP